MAGHDLIDDYLDLLATRLAWRDDADDVVAEAGDHLATTVERLEADGADPVDAQRSTLERFGDPDLVATAFATTSRGAVAVPTHFTKSAGTIAIVAALLWVLPVGLWALSGRLEDSNGSWNGAAQLAWMTGTLALIAAVVLTGVVMLALRERHGGLGPLGTAGLVLLALGGLASVLAWLLVGWGALIAVGTLLFAIAMRRVDIAPRAATLAFGSAWSLALITWIALRAAEVGTPDEWGDYWVAGWGFLLVGSVVIAAGLTGLGRWLVSEEPADLQWVQPVATA